MHAISLYKISACGLILFLSSCRMHHSLHHADAITEKVDNTTHTRNAQVDSLISPYKQEYMQKMYDTVAYNPSDMNTKQLGQWVVQGLKWYSDSVLHITSDFALCNSGGIRIKSMPQGVIQLKHIYEMMPFDNALVVIEVDSSTLDSIAQYIYHGWPHTAQFSYQSMDKSKQWSISKSSRGRSFQVLLSDFLANGGDKMTFLTKRPRQATKALQRDALIAYARHQKTIYLLSNGRK